MRPRISIRSYVRPSVRLSVTHFFLGENSFWMFVGASLLELAMLELAMLELAMLELAMLELSMLA